MREISLIECPLRYVETRLNLPPADLTPMILVFCGTPQFAVPTLDKLVEAGHSVPLVVTQPDRPRGRGMEVAVSPVKDAAIRLGIAVAQPAAIKNNSEFREQLTAIRPGRDHHRRRLWPHHSAMDDRSSPARKFESACIAAAKISRRGPHPVGDCQRRINYRSYHHAHRRRPRYRRHTHAARNSDRRSKTRPRRSARSWRPWARI